jgi:hypothetical protein
MCVDASSRTNSFTNALSDAMRQDEVAPALAEGDDGADDGGVKFGICEFANSVAQHACSRHVAVYQVYACNVL